MKIKDLPLTKSNLNVVQFFADKGFNLDEDVNGQYQKNESPLIAVIKDKKLKEEEKNEIVKFLIDHNVAVDERDRTSEKNSPLMWCIMKKLSVAEDIFNKGGRLNLSDYEYLSLYKDRNMLPFLDETLAKEIVEWPQLADKFCEKYGEHGRELLNKFRSKKDEVVNVSRDSVINDVKKGNLKSLETLLDRVEVEEDEAEAILRVKELLAMNLSLERRLTIVDLARKYINFYFDKSELHSIAKEIISNISGVDIIEHSTALKLISDSLYAERNYEFLDSFLSLPRMSYVATFEYYLGQELEEDLERNDTKAVERLFSMKKSNKLDLETPRYFNKIAEDLKPKGESYNSTKLPPFSFAILNKNYELALLLFENGANPYAADKLGYNILTRLAKVGKLLECKDILFTELNLDPMMPDEKGRTVYSIATELGENDVLEFIDKYYLKREVREAARRVPTFPKISSDIQNEALSLGKKVIQRVRRDLFIGSSNVEADLRRTDNWTKYMLLATRQKIKWKKIKTDTGGFVWRPEFTKRPQSIGLKEDAEVAARAFYNKVGNCGEMMSYGLYTLCKMIKNDPKLLEDLQNGEIQITPVRLPAHLDHTFIEYKYKKRNEYGVAVWERVYIDPWLNSCFNEKHLEAMKELMIEKLISEVPVAYDRKYYYDYYDGGLPKELQNRNEVIEFYVERDVRNIMKINEKNIRIFRKNFEIVRYEDYLIKSFKQVDEYLKNFEEEIMKISAGEPLDWKEEVELERAIRKKPVKSSSLVFSKIEKRPAKADTTIKESPVEPKIDPGREGPSNQ